MRDNITNSTTSTGRGKEDASVDREKMRKQRYRKVNSGKGKKVGFFVFYKGLSGYECRLNQ